jgi:hypothetical protein
VFAIIPILTESFVIRSPPNSVPGGYSCGETGRHLDLWVSNRELSLFVYRISHLLLFVKFAWFHLAVWLFLSAHTRFFQEMVKHSSRLGKMLVNSLWRAISANHVR